MSNNWFKRTTTNYGGGYRSTVTRNSNGKITSSNSTGGNGYRTTTSYTTGKAPKITTTRTSGGWTQRTTRSIGTSQKTKRPRKMTKAEAQFWGAILSSKYFWIAVGLFAVYSHFQN